MTNLTLQTLEQPRAYNSAKKQVGVPFKSKEELGGAIDPRINTGGRPKLLKGAYTKMLAEVDEETGKTKAELIASKMIDNAMLLAPHAVSAAKELRQATEYDDEQGKPISIGALNMQLIQVLQSAAKTAIVEGEFEKIEEERNQ